MRRCCVALVIVVAGCGGGDGPRPAPTPNQGRDGAEAGGVATAERWPQPERYSLELAYDARRFALSGSERIALRNTGPRPLTRVWLRTWGNAFGGCAARKVRVEVTGGGRAGAERAGCTALEVRLEHPLEPGAATAVELRIDVTAPERPDRFGRFAGGGAGIGMEYPELVLTPARALVVRRELAHQWWYGIVGNDQWAEPWLDESFATYSGVRVGGRAGRCAPPRGKPRLTASMKAFEHGDDYRRVVYAGGMCALRTVERRLGRARFDGLLRGLVQQHRDEIITTADVVAGVRAAAPQGVDADALLRRAGIASG